MYWIQFDGEELFQPGTLLIIQTHTEMFYLCVVDPVSKIIVRTADSTPFPSEQIATYAVVTDPDDGFIARDPRWES
jgi:hypothetical protein